MLNDEKNKLNFAVVVNSSIFVLSFEQLNCSYFLSVFVFVCVFVVVFACLFLLLHIRILHIVHVIFFSSHLLLCSSVDTKHCADICASVILRITILIQ